MTIESKIRSLLVNLDTILNPVKPGKQQSDFVCLIRPLPKPNTILTHDNVLSSELYIGIKQVLQDKEMGVIDISPAIERFADRIKAQIPSC